MAHVAPGEYAFHGRDRPYHGRDGPYHASGSLDYYPGQGDPAPPFNRPPAYPYAVRDDAGALTDAFSGMEIGPHAARGRPPAPPANRDIIVSAIEAASSALWDQASALREKISENERLRSALRVREWELHNYRIDQGHGLRQPEPPTFDDLQRVVANLPQFGPTASERFGLMPGASQIMQNRDAWVGGDHSGSLIVYPNGQTLPENPYRNPSNGGHHFVSSQGTNGAIRPRHNPEGGFSQNSSPSARSVSPIRHQQETDSDARGVLSGQDSTHPIAEANMPSTQDIVQSAPRLQDEIKHLKQGLSDAALKEIQLVHENQRLQKRLSELRLTIEKYQQELIDATSRANARVLEENAQLKADLQAADQDQNFYASALLNILAEFNLPATQDPHSIISGIKALIQHFRESRKDPMAPEQSWQASPSHQTPQHFPPPSPIHPNSRAPQSPDYGLAIVPQPPYVVPELPFSPTSQTPHEWERSGATNQHQPFSTDTYLNEHTRHPFSGQNGLLQQHNEAYANSEEDLNGTGHHFGPSIPERPERPSPRLSPQLPTLPEEPTSSFSDEEDPLPGIEGLTINGDAVLGGKLGAFGVSVYGTTLCHFQWVRHHRDGSYFHILGAAQPEYIITADDIDTRLSLECTPMDDQNRRGEMVQVFANGGNWITLESSVEAQISDYLVAGQAPFDAKILVENSEPAILTLKRSVYELKRVNERRPLAIERYVTESSGNPIQPVDIKVGKNAQCAIINSGSILHCLECNDSRTRDLLVLTMREFVKMAIDKKRAKKKSWLTMK